MGCGRLVGSERTVGVGGLMGGERFICKIYGKKYICRWAVQALHLQGG